MAFDELHDVVSVVVGEPLGLSSLVGAKIFRTLFLGWLLSDFGEADLERSLNFRADVPLSDLASDISIFAHELGEGGAVLGDGESA